MTGGPFSVSGGGPRGVVFYVVFSCFMLFLSVLCYLSLCLYLFYAALSCFMLFLAVFVAVLCCF